MDKAADVLQQLVASGAEGVASAAAMLGALIGKVQPGADDLEITVDQGVEMGRPSRIDVGVNRGAGGVSAITVAGNAVPVMRGTLTL